MIKAETLHGKWGIWLYEMKMWYHISVDNSIEPRVFQTELSATEAAKELWNKHTAKAQVRQYDMNRDDFPNLEGLPE